MILAFAVYEGSGWGRSWQTIPIPTPVPVKITPVPTIDVGANTEPFTNTKMGYTIMIPAGWEAQGIAANQNFDDRVVFTPTASASATNIGEISVTVVSKPASTQDLATDADWNKWLSASVGATDSSGLVQKFGEKMVQGNRAMVLRQDKDLPSGYDWSVMTWVRQGQVNYYIDALGSNDFGDTESRIFDFMVGSFKTR